MESPRGHRPPLRRRARASSAGSTTSSTTRRRSSFKLIKDLKLHHLDRSYAMNVRSFVLGAQRAVGPDDRRRADRHAVELRLDPRLPDLRQPRRRQGRAGGLRPLHGDRVRAARDQRQRGQRRASSRATRAPTSTASTGMPDLDEKVLPKIPKRRMGTVKEVADTVEFLLEPRSEYITGQSLVVDGGLSDGRAALLRRRGGAAAAARAGCLSRAARWTTSSRRSRSGA